MRMAAIDRILDRGMGKPVQPTAADLTPVDRILDRGMGKPVQPTAADLTPVLEAPAAFGTRAAKAHSGTANYPIKRIAWLLGRPVAEMTTELAANREKTARPVKRRGPGKPFQKGQSGNPS